MPDEPGSPSATAAAYQRGVADVAQHMIELVDACDRALDMLGPDAPQGYRSGIEMLRTLGLEGLRRFDYRSDHPGGELFDPARHEALEKVGVNPDQADRVIRVLRRGWTGPGISLRPAQVAVGIPMKAMPRPPRSGRVDEETRRRGRG